jgi:hypothetical protein
MLYNKLIRADLVVALCLLGLIFVHKDPWQSIFAGALAVSFIFSVMGHISFYKTYKKFY